MVTYMHILECSLASLESSGAFQFDITQPAGLGTKLAKTLVTRCLVGDAGVTYKYLGLRMFSIPWNEGGMQMHLVIIIILKINVRNSAVGASEASIQVGHLNKQLVVKTNELLFALGKPQTGSCNYNLALINRQVKQY